MSEDFPARLTGFRAGSSLAGYRLEAQIGAGGMAVVFRARDERLGRPVALKILAPEMASGLALRRRFIAESQAAAAVDDPHIIPVYEAGEDRGVLFIAMRFVSGGDLGQVLEREGALPPDRMAEFISPVASALDAAHSARLVHRDVKPANILVDTRAGRPDHVYLSDFGISKGAMSSTLTGVGGYVGTPDYMAPEQIEGRAVDGRTDQYALACVAYQLLTGVVPFKRDQIMAVLVAHVSARRPSLVSRRPDLPAAVDRVVATGMALTPEKRYESCGDFADALREALGLAPYHRRSPVIKPAPPPSAPPSDPAMGLTIDSPPASGAPGVVEAPEEAVPDYPDEAVEADRRELADPGPAIAPVDPQPSVAPRSEIHPPTLVGSVPAVVEPDEEAVPDHPDGAADEDAEDAQADEDAEGISSAAATADTIVEDLLVPGQREPPDLAPSRAPADSEPPVTSRPEIHSPTLIGPAPAVVEPDPAVAGSVDAVPDSKPPDVVEAPEEAVPDHPDGAADEDAGMASPADLVEEGLPAARAVATGDDQLAGDLETAAEPGEPDEPDESAGEPGPPEAAADSGAEVRDVLVPGQRELPDLGSDSAPADALPLVVSPSETPSSLVIPSDSAAVESDLAATGSVDAVPDGGTKVADGGTKVADGGTKVADGGTDMPAASVPVPGMASPADAVEEGLPVAQAVATADNQLTGDLETAAETGEPTGELGRPAAAAETRAHPSDVLTVGQRERPDRGSGGAGAKSAERPARRGGTTGAWIRRHRLPVFALACMAVAAAATIPFVPTSPSHSSRPPNPSRPPRPSSPSSPPSFSRISIDLPSLYGGLISSMAFSPSGTTLAIAGQNICLWDIAATSCVTGFGSAYSVAFSPDGKTLATGNQTSGGNYDDGTIHLWNVATRSQITTVTDPKSQGAFSVAFSPDGGTLAVGDDNGRTYLWDVATGKPVATLPDPGSQNINSVAFSPDGKILAAGDQNGRTYLWDVATRKLTATLPDPGSKGIRSVAFSPNGKILVAGDDNGSSYLWNTATGKPIAPLPDPGGRGVISVACSPDGMIMAAGDENGSTYVWNIATRKLITALTDPNSGGINSVAFSAKGNDLATGDHSGSVNLWRISFHLSGLKSR